MNLVELLRELVEIESPTGDTGEIQARLEQELRAVCACVERRGDHLYATIEGDEPPLLLLGHVDTVWPRGTLARMPFRLDGDRAYGPGTHDMKGGLVVLLEALRRTETRHAIRVVVNADEEIGSPDSRSLLAEAADGAVAAFVLEGPAEGGHLKTARKGIGRFTLTVRGRAAHAATPAEGVSAIEEFAHQVLRLQRLAGHGVTVNVGLVSGGQTVNTVAPWAKCEIDLRYVTPADREVAMAKITRIIETAHVPGTSATLAIAGEFKPLVETPDSKRLFEHYAACAKDFGLKVEGEFTGGCADSGFTAGVGTPTICAVGPIGGRAHTPDEYLVVDSLVPRAQTLALAVARLT